LNEFDYKKYDNLIQTATAEIVTKHYDLDLRKVFSLIHLFANYLDSTEEMILAEAVKWALPMSDILELLVDFRTNVIYQIIDISEGLSEPTPIENLDSIDDVYQLIKDPTILANKRQYSAYSTAVTNNHLKQFLLEIEECERKQGEGIPDYNSITKNTLIIIGSFLTWTRDVLNIEDFDSYSIECLNNNASYTDTLNYTIVVPTIMNFIAGLQKEAERNNTVAYVTLDRLGLHSDEERKTRIIPSSKVKGKISVPKGDQKIVKEALQAAMFPEPSRNKTKKAKVMPVEELKDDKTLNRAERREQERQIEKAKKQDQKTKKPVNIELNARGPKRDEGKPIFWSLSGIKMAHVLTTEDYKLFCEGKAVVVVDNLHEISGLIGTEKAIATNDCKKIHVTSELAIALRTNLWK